MPTIDDKVVAMSFESSKFESGVKNTLSALDKLKAALKFDGATKGLQDLDNAGKKIDLSHIGRGVDEVKSKLSALNVAAVAIFANIAMKAVAAGVSMVKAFTIDPMKAGFQEYATNLNAVQTILANTQASGATLKDVNAALLELNQYSDKTIYNFSQMAKNIGTFTAAGVDLKTATGAIKGIANLAALSGSNADQASTAMYQLSQAISAGRVGLQDWNSVVNAGMGGTVFQRALAQTAVAMGKIPASALKLVGPMKNVSIHGESFRQSMQAVNGKTWLTSDVLTQTLKQFTGDMTEAELKAQGFTAAQIKAIQQTGKTAMFAATEVKTLTQVLDVAKETAGSGWAQTWQIIFGDFGEAKKTFTALSNSINGFINASSTARNKVLADWKALGGRTILIEGIKTAFENLGKIIAPIKEAFRDIFPAKTGADLLGMTKSFKEFAEALKPSPATVENLHRTFAGLFAVLDIGKQIVGGIFTMFGKLFGAVGLGEGSFLDFTGTIGDFLVSLDKALKSGDGLDKFFSGLGAVLALPIKLIQALGRAVSNLFSGFSPGGFSGAIDGMTKSMTPLQKVMTAVGKAWDNFLTSLSNADINMSFDSLLAVIRTGLFGALVLMFKQFLGKGSLISQLSTSFSGGIFKSMTGSLGSLQGTLTAYQQNLKAKTLKEIAIAIALLAASVVALSFVDPKKLNSALGALTIMFGELLGAMAILNKITQSTGFVKLPFIAASMILFAAAIDLLTISVLAMSRLSWSELTKGLTGVGVLLIGVSGAAKVLSASSAGLIRAGIGIIALAVALKILASAVADFSALSWQELSKGLTGVGVGLGILVAGARLMPKGIAVSSAGLVIMAYALKVLADAVLKFGSMDWQTMGRGLAGVGASLVIIAGAMHLMPGNMIITAAGLMLVAASLGKISDAVMKMGGMSIKEIAKGLVTLGGALAILAVGLHAMSGTLAGAAALAVASAGIAMLAPALTKLGNQSWKEILKSLVTLAAALAILGAAGLIMAPVVPALLGLGLAMLGIGAGLALAGVGIGLIAAGIAALAVSGPAGIKILVSALLSITEAIPEMATNLILGLLSMVRALAATAPQFVAALVKIVDMLLNVIIKSAPKMGEAFTVLLTTALKVIADNRDAVIQAGIDLIISLLTGIRDNIGQVVAIAVDIISNFLTSLANNLGKIIAAGTQLLVSFITGIGNSMGTVVTAATNVIIKFLSSITSNLGKLVTAGAQMLTSLLNGIANAIATVATAALSIVTKFLATIASNLGKMVTAGFSILTKLLSGISENIGKAITAGTDVIVKFIKGIGNAGERIVTAGTDALIKFLQGVGKNGVKIINATAQVILDFANGLAAAIETYAPQFRAAGLRIALAIADGMTFGLASKAKDLAQKGWDLGKSALGGIKNAIDGHSPSREAFVIGGFIAAGLANGMADHSLVLASATAMANGVIGAFNTALQTASPSKVMFQIGQYVGQGFANGLRGSQDDVRSAFTELNNKLTEAMANAREAIAKEEAKLVELRKAKKPDTDAIAAAQKALNESEAILALSTAGHNALVGTLKGEKAELIGLIGQYDKVTESLKAAQDKLKELVQQQTDFRAGLTGQYSSTPGFDTTDPAAIASARKAVADEQAKLNAVLGDGTSTPEAIASAQASLKSAQDALGALEAGKILTASGEAVDQLATYEQALTQQTAAVAQYGKTLEQLRKLGLDDTTYNKLLSEGTADQAFANQLLAGGRTAVQALNTLDAGLAKVSGTLAANAARNLYQAGINSKLKLIKGLGEKKAELKKQVDDAAEAIITGFVKGLGQRHSQLRKAIDDIADEMIKELKKELKIKSPSERFAEIGKYSMEGMAHGFRRSSKLVIGAIDDTAKDALGAMRKSMRNAVDVVTRGLDVNPVITPILDLTQVQSQAKQLAGLTNVIPFTRASTSLHLASTIPTQQTSENVDNENATPTHGTLVKFEQNNYSPEALTEIEIYRHTRNQLSQLKQIALPIFDGRNIGAPPGRLRRS